jgi:hypothetical protein
MIRIFFAVVFSLYMVGSAKAQVNEIESVIGGQIEAFQSDDFAAAFKFATPMIQGMFGTPERFGMMVRNGFPMVWRPAEVQYLEQRESGGFTYQKVLIRDAEGTYFALEYEMLETPLGWQINGVRFLVEPAVAA